MALRLSCRVYFPSVEPIQQRGVPLSPHKDPPRPCVQSPLLPPSPVLLAHQRHSVCSPSRAACRHPLRLLYLLTSLFQVVLPGPHKLTQVGFFSPCSLPRTVAICGLPGSGGASALEQFTRLSSFMGRSFPRTGEPCGRRRTVWRLLPSARPSAWLLRGRDALHSFVSVGVCRPLHPPSCHSAVTTHSPALLSPPFTLAIPPTSPYIPVVPPPSPVRFPYLSSPPPTYLSSHPCHFHLGRPPLPRVMTPAGAGWLTLSPRGHRWGSHQVCQFPAG